MIYSIHQEVRRFAPLQIGARGKLYRYQMRGPLCNSRGCKRIGGGGFGGHGSTSSFQ